MTRLEFWRWFIVAFVFRIACFVTSHVDHVLLDQLTHDRWENVGMADSVLAGRGFAGVIKDHQEIPSAWCPPGYVLVLALVKGITRAAPWPMIAIVYIMNSSLNGLTTALVARLGWALGGRLVGAFAGVLHLLSPKLLRYGFWAWDMPYGDLAIVLLLQGTVLRRDPPSPREDLLAGAGLCLAGMLSGPGLVIGPTMLLAHWLRAPRWRHALRSCILMCSAFMLCQAPWVVRNYLVLGAPVLTRSTYLINAHMANVPGPDMLYSVVINGNELHKSRY